MIPFSAIFCADWLYNKATRKSYHFVFSGQIFIAFILVLLVIILSNIIFVGANFIIVVSFCAIGIILFAILHYNYLLTKAIIYPIISIYCVFLLILVTNARIYINYDLGYQIAEYMKDKKLNKINIIDYNVDNLSTEFITNSDYTRINNIKYLLSYKSNYYLLIQKNDKDMEQIKILTKNICKWDDTYNTNYIRQENFIQTLFNIRLKEQNLQNVLFVNCN